MLQKALSKTSTILFTLFFIFSLVMVRNAFPGEIVEVGSVTAVITSEDVWEGDPDADEGETRNRSHFPEHPENFKPMPLPEVEEFVEKSAQTESGWVSYNISTGEEVIHEFPTIKEDLPIIQWTRGGTGGWNKFQSEIHKENSKSNTGTFLDFTALTLINNPEEFPWRVNCKLYVTFPPDILTVSSGVLIDPLHVLTAGHCIHEGNGGSWATDIDIVPGYKNGVRPFGDASASYLYSFVGWTVSGDNDYDIGVIALDRPIGATTGWYGYGYNDNDSFFYNNTFYSPGYPAEFPYDGELMYYWFGNYDYVYENQLGVYNNGYGGQSGSGHYYLDGFGGRWVYAVHSYINFIPLSTFFTRITPIKFSHISNNIAANTPSIFDLIPLNVSVSPVAITAGDQLSVMEYLVHNYSSASWSGTVDVDVFLSNDENISSADTLIQSHNFTWSFDPKSTAFVNVSNPPTIPSNTSEGFYWMGVILDVSDYNTTNNESDGQDAKMIYVIDPDDDNDGILDVEDNCPNIPNGPDAGTCTWGEYYGEPCDVPGENTIECGINGFCSMNQEDNYPSGGNNCGDACECEGDFESDGDVDGTDAINFKLDFYRNDCTELNPCNGDFNCDGDVDGTDTLMFKADFFRKDCPSCGGWPCVYE